jgi:anti-sigma factor RsiW
VEQQFREPRSWLKKTFSTKRRAAGTINAEGAMSFACGSVRASMVRSIAGHASAAERLALEAHLAHCDTCVAEHVALEGVRRVQRWEPPSLSESARDRTRRTTLEQAIIALPPRRADRWLYAAAALLAAMTAAIALFVH